jgi:hypothetical protein
MFKSNKMFASREIKCKSQYYIMYYKSKRFQSFYNEKNVICIGYR